VRSSQARQAAADVRSRQARQAAADVRSAPAKGLAGDPFDALGDPNRRAIVELLGSGGRSVREIADELPISRPAVSRHLRLLKNAGLVVEEPRGTRRIYRLHVEGVEAVQAYLTRVWGDAAARFRLVAENTAR
jgi:DNA-binding transcriptional ArsR family regulator